MTIRREHDALAHGLVETQVAEKYSGGHSWGYTYLNEDGDFETEHGLGEIPSSIEVPEADVALVHTRLATQGEVNITNAHPFGIEDEDGDTVAMMAHNGTWHGSPDHDLYSDTWFMARVFETHVEEKDDFEDALRATAERCGETMVVLHESGNAYVYSGRFEITCDGSVVQSSGHDEIPTGEIRRIDTDGETAKIADVRSHKITRYVDL